jgi:hypothetical protein
MLATPSQVAPSPGPAFSLATVLPGNAVHAIFMHQHCEAEAQLALELINLLHTVSYAQLPEDLDMVCSLQRGAQMSAPCSVSSGQQYL